jgi:hypothetical protein
MRIDAARRGEHRGLGADAARLQVFEWRARSARRRDLVEVT